MLTVFLAQYWVLKEMPQISDEGKDTVHVSSNALPEISNVLPEYNTAARISEVVTTAKGNGKDAFDPEVDALGERRMTIKLLAINTRTVERGVKRFFSWAPVLSFKLRPKDQPEHCKNNLDRRIAFVTKGNHILTQSRTGSFVFVIHAREFWVPVRPVSLQHGQLFFSFPQKRRKRQSSDHLHDRSNSFPISA